MTVLNKLNMKTADLCSENFNKFEQLFPNCVTETHDDSGNFVKTINFDLLKQIVGIENAGGGREFYEFTWPGKRASIIEANAPITKTLRPCVEDSKDWQNTKNLYIEGDNLEALKILQESYLGKVKMIYIDPPYNTGNDFVYKDDFSQSEANYSDSVGQKNECGEKLFKNTESNGRFHSDWCSMIYSRLLLARNLLSEDGVIFISIDDHEVDNLKKICHEIFGEINFVATFPWRKRTAKSDVPFGVSQDYEWIIAFAKSNLFEASIEGKGRKYYDTPDFPGRPWRVHDMTKQTTASERPNSYFTMINPKNGKEYPCDPNRTWRITKDTFQSYYDANEIVFPGDYDFLKISKPVARYFKDKDIAKAGDKFGRVAVSTKFPDDIGMSQDGTKEMKKLFNCIPFAFPKNTKLLSHLLKAATQTDSIILDFFSGSATTAHAVMKLNAEDGGNRQFIMVQIPEKCDEKTEAFKAGYKNICEIGKERIRRAGEQIKKDHPDSKVDIGFRVFKVDSSNMKDVYYNPEKLNQDLLSSLESNVKEDRTDYDLLFSTILDLGLTLDKELKEETIGDTKVYIYNDDEKEGPDLIACFADSITEDVITVIAKRNPLKAVFKDSSFENSPSKINLFELFKTYANISDDNELQSRVRVI